MNPILFNTQMTQAILKGKKTQTRRIIKIPTELQFSIATSEYLGSDPSIFYIDEFPHEYANFGFENDIYISVKIPYIQNEELYVRETWTRRTSTEVCTGYISSKCPIECVEDDKNICDQKYIYRADFEKRPKDIKWRPSLHMPKDAARIFLKVKSTRIERLQDITEEDAKAEGANFDIRNPGYNVGFSEKISRSAIERFQNIWDSTTSNKFYQWSNNPWVEVIELERIEKPEREIQRCQLKSGDLL